MLFRRVLSRGKTTKMTGKSRTVIGMLLLSLLVVSLQLFGQQLTHEMTEEEKALMPAYLEALKTRAATPPPPFPVRSIAEFEHMEGVLIAYPLGIPVSLVAMISETVMVTTIVDGPTQENQVRNLYSANGVNMDNTNFLHAPHDSYWTRDYGPWFITDGSRTISIIDFTYNRPRPNDNKIPAAMAAFLGLERYEMDLVTAGGNYMTDGLGIAVSTDLVWEENSSKTHEQINQIMYDYLGIHTYHVMPDPLDEYIKHVDCWAKYLDVDKILIARVPQNDPRYNDYEALADYFANQTSSYGNLYQVPRVDSFNGEPYTNSFILNKRVFVPIVGSSADSAAISTYTTAMPGYEVIGVSGSWQTTDAVHCRVIGIADRGLLYIHHLPLLGEKPQQPSYDITTEIIPYSGMPVISDSVKIYYKVNGGTYYAVNMVHTSGDTYTGSIPGQPQGSQIGYYLHAADTSNRTSEHPYIGAADPHVFTVGAELLPPVADFTADTTTVIEGGSVQFTDLSTNNPTAWSWTFPGGTPGSSTIQHPLITYYTPGTYSVTLIASNAAGSDTETRLDYITVLPLSACLGQITNPGFETGSTSGWTATGSVSITTTAHSGTYGVSLADGGGQVEQVVTGLCANTTYTLSAWGIAKANAGVYLGVKNYGGSELTVQFTDSKNWQQKLIVFTTGAANTSAAIFFTKTAVNRFTGDGDDFELSIVN